MTTPLKPTLVNGGFRKVSSVTTVRALANLLNLFTEHATSALVRRPVRMPLPAVTAEDYETFKETRRLPIIPALDRADDTRHPGVHVGGFLSRFAPGLDLFKPEALPAGLATIRWEWEARTNPAEAEGNKAVRAHHVQFWLGADLIRKARNYGLPVGKLLMSCSLSALNRWAAWAYPVSSIGFLLGAPIEGHAAGIECLVFPRDSRGIPVSLSRLALVESGGRKFRVDYYGYLQNCFDSELRQLVSQLDAGKHFDPSNAAQNYVRSTTASMRDFETAADDTEAGKYQDLVTATIAVSHANAHDYASADYLRLIQAERLKRFQEVVAPLRSDPVGMREALLEIATKIEDAAARLDAHIAAIRKAREDFLAAHADYADSPFAYRLVSSLKGGQVLPNTITKQWAEGLPLHRDLLVAENPFFREKGAVEVVKERKKAAEKFSAIASQATAAIASTGPAFEATNIRVGYFLGFKAEIEAALNGTIPTHLSAEITDDPSSPFLCRPDKGFDTVKHQALEAAHELLIQRRPFSWPTDADRDFSPIFYNTDSDEPGIVSIDDPALTDAAVPRAYPSGIDPEMKFQPTDLDELLASLKEGNTGSRPLGSTPG